MSSLFITSTWPDPVSTFDHGVAQRIRLMLRACIRADPVVDVLVFAPWNMAPDSGAAERIKHGLADCWQVGVRSVRVVPSVPVRDRFDSLWHGYIKPMAALRFQPAYARVGGKSQADAVRAAVLATDPSRILVHRLNTMSAVLRNRGVMPPIALDLDDIEHKAFARHIAQPPHWRSKALMRGWLPALRRGERRALRAAQLGFVCSEADRAELTALWQLKCLRVVPNALPAPAALPPPPDGDVAMFLGMHSYEPNRVAAEYLIEQIWPRVRQQRPNATLIIAGKHCQLIRGFADPPAGVRFEGYVADLESLYRAASVVCCPILSGGGTRIKIIEAALRARPIVSTTVGAEGLDLSPARNEIAIADDAGAFAAAVVRLMADPGEAAHMGRMAQQQAMAEYSEARVVDRLAAMLSTLSVPSLDRHNQPIPGAIGN